MKYEAALRLIAARGVKPCIRPTGEKQALGCDTCYHWWDVGEEEHHSEHCAYVIARDALHGCQQEPKT